MYHVRWEESALPELADIWTHAAPALRPLFNAAVNLIDDRLEQDAQHEG